ncbi:MAG TPA: nuclear transport factor 2 family protein [Candidatus Saccharimonadales bacterium]|nr:nuclear transport factor 2 family protein [Candidatus Saccharimonadales bacterium]
MKSQSFGPSIVVVGRRLSLWALFFVLSLTLATSVSAQKKKKKDDAPPPQDSSQIVSLPDQAKIDNVIGQMLGAWQVGDLEKLHATIADDISVVSGTYAPPVIGWASYSAAYQMQRARLQQARMERTNTLIRIAPDGLFAWACYQFEFSGVVDGSPSSSVGQTTLVLEKRGDTWLIVHNHTSIVQSTTPTAPAGAAPQQPAPSNPSNP